MNGWSGQNIILRSFPILRLIRKTVCLLQQMIRQKRIFFHGGIYSMFNTERLQVTVVGSNVGK